MKDAPARLAPRYAAALKKHLAQGARTSLEPALKLGREIVAVGLDTLDLARMHEQTLLGLVPPEGSLKIRASITRRARLFFHEANTPIEKSYRAATHAEVQTSQLTETLKQRTAELAAANRSLRQGVTQREGMEAAYEKRRQLHNRCLEESLQLQKRLRQLTHRLLTAQETERKSISRELQDEIAQTLLGINVRLLTLKQRARGNTKRLKNEIASTQRLVVKSAGSVRRVVQKLDAHETQAPPLVASLSGGTEGTPRAGQAGKNGAGAKSGPASPGRRPANARPRQDS